MKLLIVNTLLEEHPAVQAAIHDLQSGASDCKVIHAYEMDIRPCVGCNFCWPKTPGIMLEFLEQLPSKPVPGTRIAFLLQGGFPEASQRWCCEKYLETLPAQLGCAYAGTLIKGDMFGVSLMDEKSRTKILAPFTEMGRYFARTQKFDKTVVNEFAAPEYMPEKQIRMFNLFGRPVQRIFMGRMAKKMGCRERLDAKPYEHLLCSERME